MPSLQLGAVMLRRGLITLLGGAIDPATDAQ